MITTQELWKELDQSGYLNEDNKDLFEVGNTILNLSRDLSKISDANKKKVIEMINELFDTRDYIPTNSSDEWSLVIDGMWQNTNDPSLFSTDGGNTYYSCNDSEHNILKSTEVVVKGCLGCD